MKIITENEYVTLKVYPQQGIIHHEFHQHIYGEPFRDAMLRGADAFIAHGCHKWLSDDRRNSAIPQADIQWGTEHWEPKIMAAGWQYWAICLPEKLIGQMNMRSLVNRYSNLGVNVQLFSDPDAALTWLESQ